MSTDNIENKHSLYCWKNCMEKFCSSLREHATNVMNYEKKKMLPLTKRKLNLHQDVTECYICRKKILKKSLLKIKIIQKLETIAILPVNIGVQNIIYVIQDLLY